MMIGLIVQPQPRATVAALRWKQNYHANPPAKIRWNHPASRFGRGLVASGNGSGAVSHHRRQPPAPDYLLRRRGPRMGIARDADRRLDGAARSLALKY